jgi:glycosyltransferase involved in cell wall biosynthesis
MKNILLLGNNGFPFGSANTYRQLQLAILFKKKGYIPCVINSYGVHDKKITERENINVEGEYDEIDYFYCSLISHRPKSLFFRTFFKALGRIIELFLIFYYRLFKKMSYIVVYTIDFKVLKYYHFISKLLFIEIIYDYVEYVDSLKLRNESNLNSLPKNFDLYFHQYIDKCIVISSFLEDVINKLAPNMPKVKLPPGVNFEKIDLIPNVKVNEKYFLYSGGAIYFSAIKFIIDAFLISKAPKSNITLLLITYGKVEDIDKIKQYIHSKGLDGKVCILSQLSYEDLIGYYKTAIALLIPLTDNIQDKARFPFKICEYVASNRVMITSNVGVINEYFDNMKSALITEPNNLKGYTTLMNFCLDNSEEINKIGLNAYEIGIEYFNVKSDFKLEELKIH